MVEEEKRNHKPILMKLNDAIFLNPFLVNSMTMRGKDHSFHGCPCLITFSFHYDSCEHDMLGLKSVNFYASSTPKRPVYIKINFSHSHEFSCF